MCLVNFSAEQLEQRIDIDPTSIHKHRHTHIDKPTRFANEVY